MLWAFSSLWFSLAGFQVPREDTPSLPLLNWTGEIRHDEKLVSWEKDQERSFTNYWKNRL